MKKNLFVGLFLAVVSGLWGSLDAKLEAKIFELDKDHTSVGFKIRHILTHVRGNFKDFTGDFETDEKGALIRVAAKVEAKSINTDNTKRDEHLRSPDFFDVAKFPNLSFVSDKFKLAPGSKGKVPGKLTIHGVTKPVEFEVEYFGEANANGFTKAGASANLKIKRKDYGLSWNKALETGGVLVGDDVEIQLEVEANQKLEASPAAAKKNKKK